MSAFLRASLIGAVALLAGCTNSTETGPPTLTGTWNIAAPSPWSTFRLTLTQTGSGVTGSAIIQPTVIINPPSVVLPTTYPSVTGTAAVDTFALHLMTYSD